RTCDLHVKMAVSVTYQQLESGADEKLPVVSFSQGKVSGVNNGVDWNQTSFKVFKRRSGSENDKRRNWRIVAARGHVLDYVGYNYGDQASKADATSKYMVGVLDRTTGKMKAYDAQLFNLKPWVKREAKRPAAAINGNTPLSTREKSDRLIETFGSNKQKRAMHSRLKNKISEDSIHKAATTAAENAKELPVELDEPDLASFQLLPPSNKETLIPSEIYRLEHIVSETLLEDLEEKGKALVDASQKKLKSGRKEESHPHFVLEKLPLSPGKSLLSIKERAAVLA
ncbi:hypothetical protein BSL78_23244, partial [Apostichopus japonicus]